MNRVFKIISIAFLILNYYFALCISSNYGFHTDLVSNTAISSCKNYYFSNPKYNLLSHIIKNEKHVNNLNRLPNSFEKEQHYDSLKYKHSKEIFIISVFSKYILKDKFTFKFFTSTDIIYPFHYFW
jgi:hypothetical protein